MSVDGLRVVGEAMKYIGTPYIYGVEVHPNEKPRAFDCSEFVEYVCRRLDVKIPDGSGNQYLHCAKHNTLITVETAFKTPGALLFMRDRKSKAICHVAISIGDGRTIEARGTKFGTNIFDKRSGWSDAAKIPGVKYETT